MIKPKIFALPCVLSRNRKLSDSSYGNLKNYNKISTCICNTSCSIVLIIWQTEEIKAGTPTKN